jgi:beta-hydroxylase
VTSVFIDPDLFAFTAEWRAKWTQIRDELQRLDAPLLDLHRIGDPALLVDRLVKHNGWTPSWQAGSTNPNHEWLTFALYYKGLIPADNATRLPITNGLLRRLRGCKVAAFSKMMPCSFIAPHAHPDLDEQTLIFHLGIEVPQRKCFLFVDGEPRAEADGEAIVFDGSREHFAINMSDRPRTIIYLEFDRARALG